MLMRVYNVTGILVSLNDIIVNSYDLYEYMVFNSSIFYLWIWY